MAWLYQPLLPSAQLLSSSGPQDLTLTAESGTFTISGQAATFPIARVISAESGTFVISGGSAILTGPDGPDFESRLRGGGAGISLSISIGT